MLQSQAPVSQLTGTPRPNSSPQNFGARRHRGRDRLLLWLLRLGISDTFLSLRRPLLGSREYGAASQQPLWPRVGCFRASRQPLRFLRRTYPDRAASEALGKQSARLKEEEHRFNSSGKGNLSKWNIGLWPQG